MRQVYSRELEWLQMHDNLLVGHRQVAVVELALKLESHGGNSWPHPQLRFTGLEMSL